MVAVDSAHAPAANGTFALSEATAPLLAASAEPPAAPLPLPSARYPVVRMLLPSAALSGVVSGADARGSEDLSGDLMQVSCQVLNASRWGGA